MAGAVLLAGVWFLAGESRKPGELDSFAGCLKEKGAIFTGLFGVRTVRIRKRFLEGRLASSPMLSVQLRTETVSLRPVRKRGLTAIRPGFFRTAPERAARFL